MRREEKLSKIKKGIRDRAQIIVSLGSGAHGQQLKDKIEATANASGESLSSWARMILADAAHIKDEMPISERVKRLENQMIHLQRLMKVNF